MIKDYNTFSKLELLNIIDIRDEKIEQLNKQIAMDTKCIERIRNEAYNLEAECRQAKENNYILSQQLSHLNNENREAYKKVEFAKACVLETEELKKECAELKKDKDRLCFLDKCYNWQVRPTPTKWLLKESEEDIRTTLDKAIMELENGV